MKTTTLFDAAQRGDVQTMKTLLANGADVNATDERGRTALMFAADRGFEDVVAGLMEYGADVNKAHPDGETPIFVASFSGHVGVVRKLLRNGALPDLPNSKGVTPLIAACQRALSIDVLLELMENGAEIDHAAADGTTALLHASRCGHLEAVRELVDRSAQVNQANHFGATPLLVASMYGHLKAVQLLLRSGAQVDSISKVSETPLSVATVKGHLEVVRELVVNGAQVNRPRANGETPLCLASGNRHPEIVRFLIASGADVNKADVDGVTPLFIAAHEGYFDIVELLVKGGALVDLPKKDGLTPLLAASVIGNLSVVKALLKSGANAGATDAHQMAPLFAACQRGRLDIVTELLTQGARVDQVNANKAAALYIAAHNGHDDIAKKLIEFGADVDQVNADGWSALYIATQNGHVEVVKTLLASNCQVDLKSGEGVTPLYFAAQLGHASVARELVRCGAQVDSTDSEGETPLYIASQNGHLEAVKILLGSGAEVNKRDNFGRTPLFGAIYDGHMEVIELLVEAGASVDVVDPDGDSPLHLAAECGNLHVVRQLLQRGARVIRENSSWATPLIVASYAGHADVMRELVKADDRAIQFALSGERALFLASQGGHLDAVRVLLDCGVDRNTQFAEGETPLLEACKYGRVDVVNELLRRGAQVSKRHPAGVPPLFAACDRGHLDIVTALLEHGARLTTSNFEGTTPLCSACTNGHSDIVRELLRRGAPVDQASREGDTPLICAARQGHLQIVKILVSAEAPVYMKNNLEESALTAAARAGKFEVLRALVEAGASVHVRPVHGETCLISAARWGHRGTADLLIQRQCLTPSSSENSEPGSSVIDATLQTLHEYADHTREFASMWDSVVQRLASLYAALGSDGEAFAKTIRQFLAIIFGLIKLKALFERKDLIFRITVCRHVASRIRDFHTELDALQQQVKSIAVRPIHSAKWEPDSSAMARVFTAELNGGDFFFDSLFRQASDRAESISLLQHELRARSDQYSEEMLKLLRFSLEKARDSTDDTIVPELPKWLIPHHELDIEQTQLLIPGSQRREEPFHAKWESSDVMLVELNMPLEVFLRSATQWYNLGHPNVVELFGAAHLRPPYTAVFENAKSTNLREHLSSPLQQHLVWQKLLEVALGLKFLHEQGVVLGNFQCRHLWVDTLGVAKINGFAVAAANLEPSEYPESVRWQSPECLRGASPSTQSDIYTFGMCVVEAVSGQIPWSSEQTADHAASRVERGAVHDPPASMTTSQWRCIQGMCWANPGERSKISRVVKLLEQFAAKETNQSKGVEMVKSASSGFSDLRDHCFPELSSTLKDYLGKLELNSNLRRKQPGGEEIGHIFIRLQDIYTRLCSMHKLPSDLGVAAFCDVLVDFHNILRFAREDEKSVDRARSRQVSLRHNVLHEAIDELLEVLEIKIADPLHDWHKRVQGDNEEHEEATGSDAATGVEVVRFGAEDAHSMFPSTESSRSDWLIPLHKIKRETNIGEGAFGEVYRGTWASTPVVVKYMGYETNANSCRQELFLHELRVWFPLRHPHVARLYGACDVDKRYFVCESISNGTLSEYLKRGENRDRKWQKLLEIAQGLQYLHKHNILHNDLKGDNFLIGANDEAKIIDFGLSSILNRAEVSIKQKNQGAVQWRSPEYLRGGERLTLASDIYAFGMCILEAVTGESPRGSALDAAVRFQVLRRKALPLQPEAMSDNQWSLIALMCAFEPADRIDISSVVERLKDFAQQEKAAASAASSVVP